jgi:hypothetical protein
MNKHAIRGAATRMHDGSKIVGSGGQESKIVVGREGAINNIQRGLPRDPVVEVR